MLRGLCNLQLRKVFLGIPACERQGCRERDAFSPIKGELDCTLIALTEAPALPTRPPFVAIALKHPSQQLSQDLPEHVERTPAVGEGNRSTFASTSDIGVVISRKFEIT
jgi:hypothetical protein